jgi:hypothetical protein
MTPWPSWGRPPRRFSPGTMSPSANTKPPRSPAGSTVAAAGYPGRRPFPKPRRPGHPPLHHPCAPAGNPNHPGQWQPGPDFLNRRGFAAFPICIGLRPGHSMQKLRHFPDPAQTDQRTFAAITAAFPERRGTVCPACGSDKIKLLGVGTEKIQEAMIQLFPDARVARMDRDTMTRKGLDRQPAQGSEAPPDRHSRGHSDGGQRPRFSGNHPGRGDLCGPDPEFP